MHDFQYVTKLAAKPVKDEIIAIIYEVQDIVSEEHFTFQFRPVGSSSSNMITYDRNSNIGFDFDLKINDKEYYSATEIHHMIKNAINNPELFRSTCGILPRSFYYLENFCRKVD